MWALMLTIYHIPASIYLASRNYGLCDREGAVAGVCWDGCGPGSGSNVKAAEDALINLVGSGVSRSAARDADL
jgi:hypothetical protein